MLIISPSLLKAEAVLYGPIYSIKLIHCGHYSQVRGRTKEFLVDGVALASLLLGESESPVSSLASFDSTPAERERGHLLMVCVEGRWMHRFPSWSPLWINTSDCLNLDS